MNHLCERTASILAIVAHPDDIDIVAGGTIARWASQGEEIHYCIVSDGDAGSPDPAVPRSKIAKVRRLEQEQAAAKLGVKAVHFLGLLDGCLQPSLELRMQLARFIRRLRPNKVVTHAPVYNLKSIRFSHPDHLAVGQSVLAAVFPDARNANAYRETDLVNLSPHAVEAVWMMGAPEPNTYVDIGQQLDTKIQAVSCHTSQLGEFGDLREFFYTWGRELAADGGFSDGLFAEAFYVMDTR